MFFTESGKMRRTFMSFGEQTKDEPTNYTFDIRKLTQTQAREKMHDFFKKGNNAEAIFNAKPSLFINLEIPSSNIPVKDSNQFKQFLDEIDELHSIFSFVKSE